MGIWREYCGGQGGDAGTESTDDDPGGAVLTGRTLSRGGTSTGAGRRAKVNLLAFCVFPAMGVTLVRRLVYLLAALSGVWVASPARAAEPPPFAWKDGDRVVLIGDALIEREQEQGMVETFITLVNPDKTITFRNLGWSGDTVFGTARARFGTEAEGSST